MAMIELTVPSQESASVPVYLSYRQIADDIAQRITKGEYADGERLPSYKQLAELYSVGTTTAQAAYRELRSRGLIEGIPGRGIFVRKANN